MRIAIVDVLGLSYDGNTIDTQGLGGSESAVVCISRELHKLGHSVTVYNDCINGSAKPGIYDGVTYLPYNTYSSETTYDVLIASRSISIFSDTPALFKHSLPDAPDFYSLVENPKVFKVLWMHDTFCDGDHLIEDLARSGRLNKIFTLSDWHTSYVTTCDHGKRRNFDILKKYIFQTRNGVNIKKEWIDVKKKDPNLFVFNASVTKGMIPLVTKIWPKVKARIPEARLTVIGGYYRTESPDAQEQEWNSLVIHHGNYINFTGVITQKAISNILEEASFFIYPSAFPETFGISTLEALTHNVPVIACNFGAMEETAIDSMCYKLDYPVERNWSMQWLDEDEQCSKFADLVVAAHAVPYLHQQKMYMCNRVKDIAGWDTVALQWDQFLTQELGAYYPVARQRKAQFINRRVQEVFGRRFGDYRQSIYPKSIEKSILVITPCKDAEEFITDAMYSVAAQDYDNYRMIVFDDASNDNTFETAKKTAEQLNKELGGDRFFVIRNNESVGALCNQWTVCSHHRADIYMLLDGDDTLVNNPYIFDMYNDLYGKGAQFTYGSCWSMIDNIPLIAQEYPPEVHRDKSYRDYNFNWGMPYTHLRTFSADVIGRVDISTLVNANGQMYKAGGDSALFYAMIETTDADAIVAVPDIVVNYNDAHAANDYKVNREEQTTNASRIKGNNVKKKILIAIPTNNSIEADTFKSIYDLTVPDNVETTFQTFHGYRVDQVRNLIADWTVRGFDYLLAVDHDIVLPQDTLYKMLRHDVDMVSGLYRQRLPEQQLEIYDLNMQRWDISDKNNLTEIGGSGFGCVLIKKDVFEKVGYPQFEYHPALDHKDTFSEDVDFCSKVTVAGYKIYADPTIHCGHIGKNVFNIQPKVHSQVNPVQDRLRALSEQDLLPAGHVEYLTSLCDIGALNPKVIYDIGACVMHWTRHAKAIWPKAEVIAFEAMSEVEFLFKEKNIPLVYGYVLGDSDGEEYVEFYKNVEHPGGNSIYRENRELSPRAEELFPEESKVRLPMARLDTLVKKFKLTPPDFIKLDVQGSELAILKGAKNTLKTVKSMVIELQHKDYNMGAPQKQEVIDYLAGIGFELKGKLIDSELGVDADYYFVRTRPHR